LPKLKRRVVILDRKISSNDLATHLVFTILAL
jgi:DNA-binding Xre family transcriptional regulator